MRQTASQRRLAALLLILAVACAPAWPQAARARNGGQKWALVVGVDRYEHAQQIRALQDAGNDARAVKKALVEAAGFPVDNVFLMTSQSGSPPTSQNILGRLASLQSLVQPGDTFVFFFSGHGAEKGNQRWLLTSDANPAAVFTLSQSSLEVKQIRDIIQSLKASRILELVDACADDPWAGGKGTVPSKSAAGMARDLTLSARREGADLEAAVTILSCKAGQQSYEGCHGHGYFTYYLVKGLRGAARKDGEVTVPSLATYLSRQLPQAVQRGEYGKRQDPWVNTEGNGVFDWVLARGHGGAAHVAHAGVTHQTTSHHAHPAPHRPARPASAPPSPREPAENPQPQEPPVSNSPPASVAMVQGLAGMRFSGKNAQGYREFVNEKDGSLGIVIPGGAFQMGDSDQSRNPPRTVTLPAYWIAKYPVTCAQYRRFVNATGHQSAGDVQQYAQRWGDRAPVVEVSWNDAVAYCEWADLRLPTEAEWEKAARGTDGRKYPWGNEWDASRCRNSVGARSSGAALVGSYPSGASPYGCLDMAGSVLQWTASLYDSSHDWRVLRGGSWDGLFPDFFRSACRINLQPGDNLINVGFRCARTL